MIDYILPRYYYIGLVKVYIRTAESVVLRPYSFFTKTMWVKFKDEALQCNYEDEHDETIEQLEKWREKKLEENDNDVRVDYEFSLYSFLSESERKNALDFMKEVDYFVRTYENLTDLRIFCNFFCSNALLKYSTF